MIPYDLDPSLHTTEPASAVLDDGFSPPQQPAAPEDEKATQPQSVAVDPALWAKSAF